MKIILILLISFFLTNVYSFALPTSYQELNNQTDTFGNYIKAVLQSSGYMPYDNYFMDNYMEQIYNQQNNQDSQSQTKKSKKTCNCVGCLVNNKCVSCLNKRTCQQIMGKYC